ncbi:Pre-mRNA-processing factor 39 [Hordeum vulgare]|nr:Pre-mRNA-processing factor 39 [Hordeum vulgare]
MGFFSGKEKGKSPAFLVLALPSLVSSRLPRERVSIPVHQARRHWEHCVLLPYRDVMLPHDCHFNPERILVPAVSRSARAHADEAWFAWEHDEQHRRDVRDVVAGPSLPLVMREEDQEAEAAYHNTLADVLRASEEEAGLKEKEEVAYQAQLAEVMALSIAGDAVVPPPPPSSPVKAEPGPLVLRPEKYAWDGVVREWFSAPPIWLGATP